MQKNSPFFVLIILSFSCNTSFEVDELCNSYSIIDGEYATKTEILPLIENNDIPYDELDTMYFKVDKTTTFKFKLENRIEYETLKNNSDFEVESYVYLKRYVHPDRGADATLIDHKIPKYTEKRIKTICDKDLNIILVEEIKKRLIEKGYSFNLNDENLKFEGTLKEEFVKYQKKNNLPYGKLDLTTLKKLGITVKTK